MLEVGFPQEWLNLSLVNMQSLAKGVRLACNYLLRKYFAGAEFDMDQGVNGVCAAAFDAMAKYLRFPQFQSDNYDEVVTKRFGDLRGMMTESLSSFWTSLGTYQICVVDLIVGTILEPMMVSAKA